ncbi:unnamed protein product [Closterium sp. NIES-53]
MLDYFLTAVTQPNLLAVIPSVRYFETLRGWGQFGTVPPHCTSALGAGGGGGGGGGSGSGISGGGSSGGRGGGATDGGSGGSYCDGGGSGGSDGSGGNGTGGGVTGTRRVGSRGGQRQQQQRRIETASSQQLREWFLRGASGGSCSYVIRTCDRACQTCGRSHTQHRCFSHLDDAWRADFGDDVELPRWVDLLKSRIAIFDLDFDAISFSYSDTLPGTAPAEALHTFTLDSGALRCFFRDSTTLTPLPAPVPVQLADHSGGPVVARSFTVLSCPAVLFGSLSGLHLPSFSTNLNLLWHHRLGHPSMPRLRGMHSCLLVSGDPRSLPPMPPLPAPPCLPCMEGRQRAAPQSSSFLPTTAPLQTLHMDVWGPARVSGQSRERYFLLVVDDYTRYTTVFPLRSKGQVVDVLIPLIRTVHLQLRERFCQDLPVLRLHSDRGGEFSSNLLREFCRGEGILLSITLPDSPQQHGIAEHRIGLVMEYAAHQLNLWPRVSLPETSPTLRWTGEVGDASFYHPTSCRVFPCKDVTFDESVPFNHPLRGPAPVQVAVGLGAARGAASGGAEPGVAESECAVSEHHI